MNNLTHQHYGTHVLDCFEDQILTFSTFGTSIDSSMFTGRLLKVQQTDEVQQHPHPSFHSVCLFVQQRFTEALETLFCITKKKNLLFSRKYNPVTPKSVSDAIKLCFCSIISDACPAKEL